MAEFAPGIPSKQTSHELPTLKSPATWEFVVQRHDAERRGSHHDVRLGDPETGHGHSWATEARWPKPGEWVWAIQQPTHTIPYFDFRGKIPEGYGAGDVRPVDRDRVEVLRSEPGHVNFNVYRGSGPEEYTLHRIADRRWKLFNRTPTRADFPDLPTHKPDYRNELVERVDVRDRSHLMSAKIDDAHNLFVFPRGGRVRAFSYRDTDRPTGLIEHTHKVPGLLDAEVPDSVSGTILRGGLYALHPETGEAVPSQTLAGLLNSNVWKSRGGQLVHGELRPVVYDVVKFRGKDLSGAPYGEKLRALEAVRRAMPAFELPRMALEPEEKRELLDAIKSGKVPETKEGVVLWPLHTSAPPIKAKVVQEHDVYVRGFFPGEGKYLGRGVGGFTFSHSPKGEVVGRVGAGLSDALREDMHAHPEKYRGAVAVVKAQERFPSGALRAPVMLHWHLDKTPREKLDVLVHP